MDHAPGDYDIDYILNWTILSQLFILHNCNAELMFQSQPFSCSSSSKSMFQNSCPDCDPASSFYGGDHCCKDVPQVLIMMVIVILMH